MDPVVVTATSVTVIVIACSIVSYRIGRRQGFFDGIDFCTRIVTDKWNKHEMETKAKEGRT